jgi:hypothetical protein
MARFGAGNNPLMHWAGGRVAVEDSVSLKRSVGGAELRDAYARDIEALTLRLVRMHGTSLWVGPIEIVRFGNPRVSKTSVEWPIAGGLLAGAPGGSFTVKSGRGKLVATLEGYRPILPRPLYFLTQLPIHHLVSRMHLMRVRGRRPAPGVPATPAKRLAAGAIDLAFCAGLAAMSGRRRTLSALLGIATGYHVACWSISGQTLGGMLMKQRVVALDGSRPSAGQALVRLLALPMAAIQMRATHDQAAGTDVVES